jgi:hypothetical protein
VAREPRQRLFPPGLCAMDTAWHEAVAEDAWGARWGGGYPKVLGIRARRMGSYHRGLVLCASFVNWLCSDLVL